MRHPLQALLMPQSVALVGASERAGAVGRVVFENLRHGGFHGSLHAVNPHHARVFDAKAYPTLRALPEPVDLAVIATPARAVETVLDDAAAAQVPAVAVITDASAGDARSVDAWLRAVARRARTLRLRMVGPGAFGVVRTDIGLNATFADVAAIPGKLALVSQSGAVATAMLDFAAPMGIGFSTVLTTGAGVDVGIGELLDFLVADAGTEGILLYLDEVANARRFMSALRAAARVKPVVVLKAGRSLEGEAADGVPGEDEVFDAALHRAGTVRVATYTQLFAAARALAMGRLPQGGRLAIVANGRGAALLAADRAKDLGLPLAALAPATMAALERLLPGDATRGNPIDVRGTASASRYAEALGVALADPNVDAVIALEVPRPVDKPESIARAAAEVARESRKPVLGAWLGSVERSAERLALDAGGIANFYTPENAVEALSYLVAYRRNQQWLLEAPSSQVDDARPDLARAEGIRAAQQGTQRRRLDAGQATALLEAFGIAHAQAAPAGTRAAARAAARRFGYPVLLMKDGRSARRVLAASARALDREFAALDDGGAGLRVVASPRIGEARAFAAGVHIDPTFGPVLTLGAAGYYARRAGATMLPPLSLRLALDLIDSCIDPRQPLAGESRDALARLLLRLSTMVCALPWLRRAALEPVVVGGGEALVVDARIDIDPGRATRRRYAHMAIHPYPTELEATLALPDGALLAVRPIRPEDAALERAFVAGLSDTTRYYRFFYRMSELSPNMLARFTQVDYDRELALVALPMGTGAPPRFVGVARYIEDLDGEGAEFAVVVADDWQGRGIGRLLMRQLVDAARRNGVLRFQGTILRVNQGMIRFVESLGFTVADDPGAREQVVATLELGTARARDSRS